jgi:hypothetical protein
LNRICSINSTTNQHTADTLSTVLSSNMRIPNELEWQRCAAAMYELQRNNQYQFLQLVHRLPPTW